MRVKVKQVLMLVSLAFLMVLTGCSQKHENIKRTSTATIFFHGYKSSVIGEKHMVHAIEEAGVTDQVICADVAKDGKVTLIGEWKKNAKNPICEVNYRNNANLDYDLYGQYATNVVKALQKRYGIKKINMVGHSMGNISIIYYMLKNGQNKNMPQLQKQVDIAGPFSGLAFGHKPAAVRQPEDLTLDKNGKPNKIIATYRKMMGARKAYPKGQVSVLNIIGDTGGGTDRVVPNVSSLSLKYLVADRAKSYQEIKITGNNTQHTKLHESNVVDEILIKYLWGS